MPRMNASISTFLVLMIEIFLNRAKVSGCRGVSFALSHQATFQTLTDPQGVFQEEAAEEAHSRIKAIITDESAQSTSPTFIHSDRETWLK